MKLKWIIGLWQSSVHSDVAFDPSMSALSILASLEFEVALSMLCSLVKNCGVCERQTKTSNFMQISILNPFRVYALDLCHDFRGLSIKTMYRFTKSPLC